MNLLDGLPGGRSRIADSASAASLRPVATDGAAPKGGTGAAFDDILSRVSRRDGVTDESSAQTGRSDAATPGSIHRAFSVNISDAAARITTGDPASAASGDFGSRTAATNFPGDQTPDPAPWLAKAAVAKTGIEGAGGAVETVSGGAGGPAGGRGSGGPMPAAQSLAPPPRLASQATDVGSVSGGTKRSMEADAAPAAVNPIQTSASGGGGETADDVRAAAFFVGSTAGVRSPAFSGRPGADDAPGLAAESKSSAPVRGVAWVRPAGRTRPDGATVGSERDPAALQASTQAASPVGAAAAAPPFSLMLLAGGSSIAASGDGETAVRSLTSDGGGAPTRMPAPLFAAPGAKSDPGYSPPAPTGDATRLSSFESPPLSLPGAPIEQSPVKVAVLGRQTHFPPLVPAAPVDQIVNRIATATTPGAAGLAAYAGGEESSGIASAAGAGEVQPQTLSATRVLRLQLDPEGLGAVSIRMRLSGNRLDLQLESDRADTMRRIGEDSGQLVEKLRAAGYVTDHLVVRVAEPHMEPMQQGGLSAGENSASESRTDAQALSPGMSQQGDSNADAGPGAQRDHGPTKTSAGAAEVSSPGRDDSGAVYL